MLVMLMCMVASLFVKATGLPFWTGGIFLFFLGIILYVINVRLITHFIDSKMPGLLDIDYMLPPPPKGEEYLWEKTAGTGIVPKWVSWIGLCALACGVGIIVWYVILI